MFSNIAPLASLPTFTGCKQKLPSIASVHGFQQLADCTSVNMPIIRCSQLQSSYVYRFLHSIVPCQLIKPCK